LPLIDVCFTYSMIAAAAAAAAAVFFSQVMLVRKKNATDEGQVFAMKVLKKDVISAKGQVEHTKSERDILFEVRHPYIVRLRYAFQSDDKLYLVTDYYNGGTLFYHLRKSRQFTEERAKFYAAELLSALGHLHQQNIIYRDLKLENVLMDHQGHLALTDFGLSKQNIDATGGATTFCGTAEYIAPELLKGQKYGAAVDWWSFGILL
jgi:serine/threonine protein kinase